MTIEDLRNLIMHHGFDKYQSGLSARFAANGLNYKYCYNFDNGNKSIIVELSKKDINIKVELNIEGIMLFSFNSYNKNYIEKFKECTSEDLHIMIAHASNYLRHGNFNYHKKWYDKLNKI